MHTNTSIAATVESIKDRAKQQLQTSVIAAQAVLAELWRMVATRLADEVPNPFSGIDWYSFDMDIVLEAWRAGIKEWRDAGFQGMTPGQIALAAALDAVADAGGMCTERDLELCRVFGVDAASFIRATCAEIFGSAGDDIAQATLESLTDQIQQIQYDEAMAAGIPPGVHTEFCWVPNWDGESLDALLDDCRVPSSGPFRGIEDLVPSNGLAKFLTWANVSTLDLIDSALIRDETQGSKLREKLRGFEIAHDYTRPAMLKAEEVIDLIESSTELSVPVVHCEVDVAALLKLDPRQAYALPMRGGCMHIGLHDFFNGAGYVDVFPGTPVVPSMALGYGWPGRWRYGIDRVYGIVKHPFHCRPQAVEAPQRELQAA
jgi:hypothetical protein